MKFSKLNDEESADLLYNKMIKRKSYTSLVAKQKSEEVTIDIAVSRILEKGEGRGGGEREGGEGGGSISSLYLYSIYRLVIASGS